MNPEILTAIRSKTVSRNTPFYLYDAQTIRRICNVFTEIPYEPLGIHFATMANASPDILKLVKEEGIRVFVNSLGHLRLALELGYRNDEIIYTSSALDADTMAEIRDAGAFVNMDSMAQLELWWKCFPGESTGIRCNIGDLVTPRETRGGYFLGKESRLGLTVEEIQSLEGDERINGLHVYVGTDIVDVDYFEECYRQLAGLARLFPRLEHLDFGGGFGVPTPDGESFDFKRFGAFVSDLMEGVCSNAGRPVRLILEPGRIITGEAGYFVCRVNDIKIREGKQLIGVNASTAQFPRPLFYPESAYHPVTVFSANGTQIAGREETLLTDIYGCSTYSRDFLSRNQRLQRASIGDIVVFAHSGAYCASAYTTFLGFEQPKEIVI